MFLKTDTAQKPVLFPEFTKSDGSSRSFEGVIFDFDGTLVDSMFVWDHLDIDFCTKYGLTMKPGYSEKITALGFEGTARYFIEDLGLDMEVPEVIDRFNDMAYDQYAHEVLCKPGVKKYLALCKARGVKVGIASSLGRKLLEVALKNNGLSQTFDTISLSDECGHDKYESDIYLIAAKNMGVRPDACLVFEDIVPAIRSAQRAGMFAVGVLDKHEQQDTVELRAVADTFIESFEDLLPSR